MDKYKVEHDGASFITFVLQMERYVEIADHINFDADTLELIIDMTRVRIEENIEKFNGDVFKATEASELIIWGQELERYYKEVFAKSVAAELALSSFRRVVAFISHYDVTKVDDNPDIRMKRYMHSYRECNICGEKLPLNDEHFGRMGGKNKIYFNRYCKECRNERQRLRAAENREQERDRNRQYHKELGDWARENKDKMVKHGTSWSVSDRDYLLENYHKFDIKELCLQLGRTPSSVMTAHQKFAAAKKDLEEI